MIGEIQFSRDRATYEEISRHLLSCDMDFFPPLSERVRIPAYAKKLMSYSARFEAWHHGTLGGLVAAYCNDPANRTVYISSFSVLAEIQHQGIGACLLKQCLEYVHERRFTHVELRVDSRNDKAIRLYERFGFEASQVDGEARIMRLHLGSEGKK